MLRRNNIDIQIDFVMLLFSYLKTDNRRKIDTWNLKITPFS